MGRKPNPENLCKDCGIYLFKDYNYPFMVTEELWDRFGCGRGMICFSCFGERIGRDFRPEDFIDCGLNDINPKILEIKKRKDG